MSKGKPERNPVTLATIGKGAAAELFDEALLEVLENIADPNTDHKSTRSIRLVFSIKPNEDRNVGDVTVSCSTKLAALEAAPTLVYMGRDGGRLLAVEQPTQDEMFPAPGGELVGMTGGKGDES